MRAVDLPARVFCALVIGLACLGGGIGLSSDALMQSGAALGVASLALLGVASGLATWREERRRARADQARHVYTELARQLMARFSGAYQVGNEGPLRADVATWASAEVVIALREWNREFDSIGSGASAGVISLTTAEQEAMRSATAAVVSAIRADLGADKVDSAQIEGALFNVSKASSPPLES